jgi:hypothetical protein
MNQRIRIICLALIVLFTAAALAACSGGGGGGYRSVHVGYGGYYGARPWGYYPSYGHGGIDPGLGIDDGPAAAQLPDMGMPDMGGMDMDMGLDMGGFDF